MLCIQKVEPHSQKLLELEKEKNSRNAARVSKRQQRTVSSWLASSNMYSVLHPENLDNKIYCQSNTKKVRDVQCILWPLREVQMKIKLEKLENHEGVAVRALLDSGAAGLFMNTQFAKRRGLKLERLRNLLLVRNID